MCHCCFILTYMACMLFKFAYNNASARISVNFPFHFIHTFIRTLTVKEFCILPMLKQLLCTSVYLQWRRTKHIYTRQICKDL